MTAGTLLRRMAPPKLALADDVDYMALARK
jgi:hypothetical protein